jgi:hypothetical protein
LYVYFPVVCLVDNLPELTSKISAWDAPYDQEG